MKNLTWEYDALPHALICGGTGGGKTYFLLTIIEALLQTNAQLYILDPKNADLADLGTVMDNVYHTKEDMPNQLSGGQQQRVALARALATKPAIILADEPTGNLDSRTSQDVLGLMKISSQKLSQTIVMITHNDEIAQMADRIIRLEDGKIVKGGE